MNSVAGSAAKEGSPKWDFSRMEHTCWPCGGAFVGVNKLFIPGVGFIKSNICSNCWIGCSGLCLESLIYARNQDVSRSAIRRMVDWQKFCLIGEFRG